MKDRGKIVEYAVRKSGIAITRVAELTGYNRKSFYDFFKNPNLSLDTIVKIGKAIQYDFRGDFPELFITDTSNIVSEPSENYNTTLMECIRKSKEWEQKAKEWEQKYYTVLEENSSLKTDLLNKDKK